MNHLRTLIFFAGWTWLTLAMGLLGLPCLLSRRASWWLGSHWAGLSLGWLRMACGITSEQRGAPQTPLIACKHQSTWDTLMLWRACRNPAFVLKRELYLIPIFGWYLWRSGQIAIDRSDGRGALVQIETQAMPLLAAGRQIIIFPEGTRVPPGQHQPFRKGVARISAALQLPVTPAALNAGYFWPKRPWVKKPGHAVLAFLPPVAIGDHTQDAWMLQLERSILEASAALAPTTK